MIFALVSPRGKIIEDTLGRTKWECEGRSFSYMAKHLGQSWESKFWKQWHPAQKDIRKRGYRIERIVLSRSAPQGDAAK